MPTFDLQVAFRTCSSGTIVVEVPLMISSAIEHDVGQGSAQVSFGCLCNELSIRLQESASLPNRSETLQCDFSWYQGGLSLLTCWIGVSASRSLETCSLRPFRFLLCSEQIFCSGSTCLTIKVQRRNCSCWGTPQSIVGQCMQTQFFRSCRNAVFILVLTLRSLV